MIVKLIGATALVALSSSAVASNSNPGRITGILPLNNAVLFNHDGSRTPQPACATVVGRWAFDASTPAGQAKLSVLLTAYSSGKKISVIGTGQCDVQSDTETLTWFVVND